MELENIKLTEVSQAQKYKYHFLCPMWISDSNFHIYVGVSVGRSQEMRKGV